MLRKIILGLAISLIAMPVLAADNPTLEDINNRIFAGARANVKSISAPTLKSWLEKEMDFLLLDVREPNEVEAARIEAKNHVEIPRGVVEFVFPQRNESAETIVVVYCLLGNRSAVVADLLTKYGYTDVYNLDGGIMSWIEEGYPISNFIGSFRMKDLDSMWLNILPED